VVGVFWNFTAARYGGAGAGTEPSSGFYVAVVADAEFVLLLGDLSRGYVEQLHGGIPVAASRMVRRRERFVGCGRWSTRARFSEAGAEHEIGVALDGDAEGWVAVDGRKVVQLRRLRWNFRGSHTIFVDGGASAWLWTCMAGSSERAAASRTRLPPAPCSHSRLARACLRRGFGRRRTMATTLTVNRTSRRLAGDRSQEAEGRLGKDSAC
jgi:hypothetical protein